MARSSFVDEYGVETSLVGGLAIACLDLPQTADLMIVAAEKARSRSRPYFMTSANGEVIARCLLDQATARLFEAADLISADGQPMVLASRFLCRNPLPERVATTDLFGLVAERAERRGVSFYLLGGDAQVNRKAAETALKRFPKLRLLGTCDGFFDSCEAERRIDEISRLAPDILWIGMGVPREQAFAQQWIHRLGAVGVVKTTGGLFDFVSQRVPRAPGWMQACGLECAWRLSREPRRLFWRYAMTNPLAVYAMITRSR